MRHLLSIFIAASLGLSAFTACAGSVDGTVKDEQGEPIPFVTVYIEGTTIGTTTNAEGDFHLQLADGYHTVVFRYVGYSTEIRPVNIPLQEPLLVVLKKVVFQLDEARVNGNEDLAYRIMRLARSRRKFFQRQVRDYSCKVYVKGLNYVKNLPKRILGKSLDISGLDDTRSGIVYLSESLSEFHFKAPNKTKERVIASKVSGNSQGFTWNNATSLNFNFYDRTYDLSGLSDRGLVSPLSPSANLYYRYVYRGFYIEDSIIVNKIELFPRVKGVPLFKGFIYIQENTWRIHGADVYMTSEAGIDFVDTVRMKVDFIPLTKDLWMKGNLSFDFTFNVKLFKVNGWGTFTSVFSDYNIREYLRDTVSLNRYAVVEEPSDESENETVADNTGAIGDSATQFDFKNWNKGPMIKVESEANEMDSLFWQRIRTVPLTALEKQDYEMKDSLEVVKETLAYKDSIDRKNNRPAARDLLYGYTYHDSKRNLELTFQTPLTAVQFNTVEGYLINYAIGISRTDRDKGTSLSVEWFNRYGFLSTRYYTKAKFFYRFNQTDRMSVRAEGGHYVQQYQQDAIEPNLNSLYTLFFEQNYMKLLQHDYGRVSWGMEALNGLRVNTGLYFGQRSSLKNSNRLSGTYIDNKHRTFTSNEPQNIRLLPDDALYGAGRSLVWQISLRYRPGLKYIDRPNGKINLGTRWPTFRFSYQKGIGGFGGLDANFDLLRLKVSDDHSLGMVGRLQWIAEAGWFPNNSFVPFMNWLHFNTSQVHVIRKRLNSFRALPYYAASTYHYSLQAHVEQHFNGFLMNKIPLIKKLKWQVVGGMHYLYEPRYGNYWEVTAGIENIFKIIRVDFIFPFREQTFQQFTFRFQLGF